jgi:ABC-type protease/lipase transport system fused ATPase/permease subunit
MTLLTVADRLIILQDGGIAMDGARDEVLKKLQTANQVASTVGNVKNV